MSWRQDQWGDCRVSLASAACPSLALVFAVGAGGDPGRHASLLQALSGQGCAVVAPHFERLSGPVPGTAELLSRAGRLQTCLDHAAATGLPVAGLGHSIGAAMLLGLAGARIRMRTGALLDVQPDLRIGRLVLMTPAMDFFRTPGALEAVGVPIQAWAGLEDTVTPPEQTAFLAGALAPGLAPDVRYVQDAGHFSFMDSLPPHVEDRLPDRDSFLQYLAAEIGAFLAGG